MVADSNFCCWLLAVYVCHALQGLGIRRQDHAKSIVKHITAKFDQNLYSKLQEFEVLDPRVLPLTLCVEGNISAGKSTFLQYITNNNEELKQQLGVSPDCGYVILLAVSGCLLEHSSSGAVELCVGYV
jgi:hypothetical protein